MTRRVMSEAAAGSTVIDECPACLGDRLTTGMYGLAPDGPVRAGCARVAQLGRAPTAVRRPETTGSNPDPLAPGVPAVSNPDRQAWTGRTRPDRSAVPRAGHANRRRPVRPCRQPTSVRPIRSPTGNQPCADCLTVLLASIVQCPCGDHARCARCPNLLALDGAGVYDHLVAAHDMGER